MGAKEKTNSIGRTVPELAVADVERAQQHYRDALGFEIGWLYPGKEIGAVPRGVVGGPQVIQLCSWSQEIRH